MTDIYLISCVAAKLDRASHARDLYQSPWFKKARAFVERHSGDWYILSAKHGLTPPAAVIEPYEQTLNRVGVATRRAWAQRVQKQIDEQIANRHDQRTRCVVLAGERYREFLVEYLRSRFELEIPMQGLAIGRQLQWLTDH
ncbi:DUF6884 domain-containing protein [Burkholderia gladioli]|uniref:DUF6884 domain-containing protein n=1 Tax=Burkholderia gladioli TaxID=28095 RepID=UPI00163E3ECD|nr:DUF6884 domain-containing protein [Burkholderia gladioli]